MQRPLRVGASPEVYRKNFYQGKVRIPKTCCCCGRNTWRHGSYTRSVEYRYEAGQSDWCLEIPVARTYCPDCRITFSFLPAFVAPWQRVHNKLREWVIREWSLGGRGGPLLWG